MTRLTEVLLKNYNKPRKFNNYRPAPLYKVLLPPVLKDSVSSKGEKNKTAPCVQEMTVMFACWKKNDFIESKCSSEMESFNQCMVQANAQARSLKEKELSPTAASTGPPSTKTINKLLTRHPQPPPTIKVKF